MVKFYNNRNHSGKVYSDTNNLEELKEAIKSIKCPPWIRVSHKGFHYLALWDMQWKFALGRQVDIARHYQEVTQTEYNRDRKQIEDKVQAFKEQPDLGAGI